MNLPRPVADVLKDHVTLEVEAMERTSIKWKASIIAPAEVTGDAVLALPGHSERDDDVRLGSWCPIRGHRPGDSP